jgi:type II secretory pathway pseudopilin PulG
LEVLVALLVLGLMLGTLFQAFSQSKRISWRAQQRFEALRIANNLLQDGPLIQGALGKAMSEGQVPEAPGWRYRFTVTALTMPSPKDNTLVEIPAMKQLMLCLVKDQGGTERQFCLTRWYRQ